MMGIPIARFGTVVIAGFAMIGASTGGWTNIPSGFRFADLAPDDNPDQRPLVERLLIEAIAPGKSETAARDFIEAAGATCRDVRHGSPGLICTYRGQPMFDGDLLVAVDWRVRVFVDKNLTVSKVAVANNLESH